MTDIICAAVLFAVFELIHFRAKHSIKAVLATSLGGIAALALIYTFSGSFIALNVYTVTFSALSGIPGALLVYAYYFFSG